MLFNTNSYLFFVVIFSFYFSDLYTWTLEVIQSNLALLCWLIFVYRSFADTFLFCIKNVQALPIRFLETRPDNLSCRALKMLFL